MQARDMLYDPAKHKTVQHYNVEGHTHYLTFSCHDGLPLLTNELWLSWLSAAINKALARHRYNLTSFVYMPEHVHLIVWPRDEKYCIEDFLYAVKKPFSDRMKKMLQQPESSLFRKLSSVEGAGKTAFRFWQKGPGHDRNLFTKENIIKATEYIHNNPVRRGLCKSPEAWRRSSWKFYYTPTRWKDSALPNVTGFSP